MPLRYIMLVFLFVLLSLKPPALSKTECNLDWSDREVDDDKIHDAHPPCYLYKTLATVLLKDDRNFYRLQNVFFPPNNASPVFVAVIYHYDGTGANSTTFFWSSHIYFFFHPVRIFQFTSLLLSDPSLRYDEVELFLPANYSNASDSCMILLTQRLQLYAMHQKFDAPIDNTYTASAHSAETVLSWFNGSHVGDIAISAHVMFPVLVTIHSFLFLLFILELKPFKHGKKLQNELESKDINVKAKAESNLLTKYTVSLIFHLFTLGVDIAALVYYRYLPKAIRDYFCVSHKRFWLVPIVMTTFDSLTFVLFIVIPPIVACSCKKSYILIYTIISPLSCIASHSYHIVFAFIIDPYHATSILLVYAIIAFVHVLSFQKLFYYINTLISGGVACRGHTCHIENHCGKYLLTIGLFTVEFVLMGASISISIAFLMTLPLSNAIDDAPNHLYVIYQASVAFFAALIAFQVLFRQTSSAFDVFIKAWDTKKMEQVAVELKNIAEGDTNDWENMSEKEKEMWLANLVIAFLKINVKKTTEDPQTTGNVKKTTEDPQTTGKDPPTSKRLKDSSTTTEEQTRSSGQSGNSDIEDTSPEVSLLH